MKKISLLSLLSEVYDQNLEEKESLSLDGIAKMLTSANKDLIFDVFDAADRIDVRGSQQDLFDFGNANHGKSFGEYEVFHTDDDDRGEIVRIVKSDKISRKESVREESDVIDPVKEAVASKGQVESIISDALEDLSEDIADYYEVEVKDEGSMQRKPGMGFIPNYDAGHNYSALVPLSYLYSTGKGVPNVIQPFVDSAIADAEEEYGDSDEMYDALDQGDGYVNF